MLLAHGGGGEKSDSFSRRGEQDRPALWNLNQKQVSCNCSGGTVATKYYFTENPLLLGIPSESGSARLGHIPSLPGNRNCPWNLAPSFQPFVFKGNCDSSSSLLDFYYSSQTVSFAPQMWAARPHLGSIFEKLLHRKTFYFVCDSHSATNSTQNKTSRPLFQTRICWFFCIKMQLKFSYGV